jgi:GNAT superfamily N-acetyltransferase
MRLERLVVCRERQGKGLGTIVLGRLEDEARAKGAGVLRLFVEPGDERVKGFYRNRGYQEVDHPYDEELKIFVKPLG